MRIWKWLDKGVNSWGKRQALFFIILSAYWLWQLTWQSLLLLKLVSLSDYTGLFSFLPLLQGFQSSFLVRFVMSLISTGEYTYESVFSALQSIGLANGLMLLLSFLAGCTYDKTGLIFVLMSGILVLFMALVRFGFDAASLQEVVNLLNTIGKAELILHILCIFWFLFCFLIHLKRWITCLLEPNEI